MRQVSISTTSVLVSLPAADAPLSELASRYVEVLLKGDRRAASSLILDSVEAGTSIQEIYLNVFAPSQYEIGRLWQTSRITVGQEHLCTATTQMIMSQLYARVFASPKNGRTLVAACVGGDLHEIGCRMVADLFELEGWNTFYFGANTPTSSIVQAILEHNSELLAISATMTFHLRAVAALIAEVRAADPNRRTKIIVGGYPFKLDPILWQRLGADAYAPDAQSALEMMQT
jgi:methanogenic corrinoid protein MtbC1